MRSRCNLVICIAAISLLAACGDAQDADKKNFQNVLQSYYDTHPVCTAVPFTLPMELRSGGDSARKRQLEPLVKAGLISVETIQKNDSAAPGQRGPVEYLRYAPTALGGNAIRKGANSFLGGTDICFARRKVINIVSFTKPAEVLGVTLSRVTYDYDLKDIEPWAKTAEIATAFPQIGTTLAKSDNQTSDVLLLTKQGWKLERDVR